MGGGGREASRGEGRRLAAVAVLNQSVPSPSEEREKGFSGFNGGSSSLCRDGKAREKRRFWAAPAQYPLNGSVRHPPFISPHDSFLGENLRNFRNTYGFDKNHSIEKARWSVWFAEKLDL